VKHIMIDLETMGLRPDAAIVSIGAVHFEGFTDQSLDHGAVLGHNDLRVVDTLHVAVSLKSCLDAGLTTDQSTVDWWAKQSAQARSSWQQEGAPTLLEALTQLSRWALRDSSDRQVCPWGNGADFDLVLLKSAYGAIGADPPWRYYNHRCYRTVKGLFPVAEVPRQGTHHNALDDAMHQVSTLRQIVRSHRLRIV